MHIVAPDAHFRALGALVHAYREVGVHVTHTAYGGEVPSASMLTIIADDCDALLLSADGRRAPRTLIEGPVIMSARGRPVPVGILTARTDLQRLAFASAAARVHREYHAPPLVAILSQRHPRYVQVARRVDQMLQESPETAQPFLWTSDIAIREDMLKGIGSGIGVALYVGHGRPNGWVGYYGLRAHHFPTEQTKPLGVLLSLCCQTASRRKTGLSFAERVVFQGNAAACLAAVTPTKFTDNTRWAVRLTQGIQNGAENLFELLRKATPPSEEALAPYRIIGDPLAPITSATEASILANSIKTYA